MKLKILVSSAGRRVGLIECFRRAAIELRIGLEILACDLDPDLSAGCQIADRAFAVPKCNHPDFVDAICEIVRVNGVGLVVPTIDPELLPLSRAASRIAMLGARVHVSEPQVVEIVRNKLLTMQVLGDAGVAVPWTEDFSGVPVKADVARWPLFMKPKEGSASRGLKVVRDATELPQRTDEPFILQELLIGPEYTVNMFIDMAGVLRSTIVHRRLQVRAGEVEKGRTERHPELSAIAKSIVRALPGARGVMCFQAISDTTRGFNVFEINARFGGGYPLADEAGGKFARWLLEEVAGLPCSANDDWRENVTMLRYDAAVFRT